MNSFEKNSFKKRLVSMLKVDARKTFVSTLYYIMLGVAFVMPILILVMTTMMDGTVNVNPQTGVPTVIEGFDNVYQAIGILSSAGMSMEMDFTGMCNINMLYFLIAVPVCIFISDDFRSGYAKNLFTVRAKKSDYVISKTAMGFAVSLSMILAFFVGTFIGGAVSNLPFTMQGFNAVNLIMCMFTKIFVSLIFVAIFVLASVIAKQKLWLSMVLSFCFSMLFYTMVPMITPLDASFINVILTLVGGILIAVGLGLISNAVLKKTALV